MKQRSGHLAGALFESKSELFNWNSRSPSLRPSPPGRGRILSNAGFGSTASNFSRRVRWRFHAHETLVRRADFQSAVSSISNRQRLVPTSRERIGNPRYSRQDVCATTAASSATGFKDAKRVKRSEESLLGERARVRILRNDSRLEPLNRQRQVGLGVLTPLRPSRVSRMLGGGVRTPSPTFRFVGRASLGSDLIHTARFAPSCSSFVLDTRLTNRERGRGTRTTDEAVVQQDTHPSWR